MASLDERQLVSSDAKWVDLSVAAVCALDQLFVDGPTWDGHLVTRFGRDELVTAGFAFRYYGWTALTQDGLNLALNAAPQMQGKLGDHWYSKATNASPATWHKG
jgi:hypothetical protein